MVEFSFLIRNLNREYGDMNSGKILKGKVLLKRAEKAAGLVAGSDKDLPLKEAARRALISGKKMQKFLDGWMVI